MKQRWGLIVLVAVVSFLSGGWLLRGARERADVRGPELLQTVLQYINRFYVDSVGPDSLYDMAAAGAVKQLNDPYSTLEDEEDYRSLSEVTSGNYGGLGMQIDVRDGLITVVAPLPGTPAERAGIQAGDQIENVDGHSTQDITQDKAVKVLRGAPGTRVELQIHRPGSAQMLPFSLVREVIHNRSVQPGTMLNSNIGYVALSTVSDSSAGELRSEINGLLKQGMKGLILDLRENPGGLLTQGVSVSDLFLDPGRKIVETRGRMPDMNHQFVDQMPQQWPTLPVVVLVNEYTASAAEIIAGALQDNDRAVIVGNATFGKGLVQTLWPFGSGRGLKLTTGRWYTPSGRTIQRTASSQADQVRLASAEATRAGWQWLDSLPSFKTVSGRIVKGGGGIVPDRLVRADTLSDGEKDFAKGIGTSVAAFRDALVAEALDIKGKHAAATPDFQVTDAMRQALIDRLRAKHVTLTPEQIASGTHLLDEQLSYEVDGYVFGRAAQLRRRSEDDPQVRTALDLFAKGATEAALLAQVAGGPSGQ
ncbi:MAG TPA: S41 family peptidase [Gemmatimonadales bacterium]|jgi:carboxyl-terminal processing protease